MASTQWEAAFLYREFEGEVVSDSSAADVIVRSRDRVRKGDSRLPGSSAGLAPECEGATDVELSLDGDADSPPDPGLRESPDSLPARPA